MGCLPQYRPSKWVTIYCEECSTKIQRMSWQILKCVTILHMHNVMAKNVSYHAYCITWWCDWKMSHHIAQWYDWKMCHHITQWYDWSMSPYFTMIWLENVSPYYNDMTEKCVIILDNDMTENVSPYYTMIWLKMCHHIVYHSVLMMYWHWNVLFTTV